MIHTNHIRALILGVLLLLPGCAGLLDPGPPMARVLLPVRMPQPSTEDRLPLQLLVSLPAADESNRTDRITALMNGFEVRALDSAKWVGPVPQMVQRHLVDALESTRRFAAVGREESTLNWQYRLGTDIRRFHLRYDDGASAPTADIAMVFTLISRKTGEVLARKLAHAEEQCAGNSLKAFVEAFGRGMTRVLAETSRWAAERLEFAEAD